jgi:CRISPR-associated protein Cas5t
MKFCVVQIKTQTATFRNPEFQNFHKSLLLPPPSTMVGFAGAAMGLSPQAAQEFFNQENFKLGVFGTSQGIAKDLWKYNDFKSGSIILKEILFINEFILVYGAENESTIKQLQTAFYNPTYALTLGNNDALAKIINVTVISETTESYQVQHCLVEGDIVQEVVTNADNGLDFSIYTTSDPIAYDLPTKFAYQSEYGIRNVIERKTLSFVGEAMTLNVLKKGILYQDKFIPIFNYGQPKAKPSPKTKPVNPAIVDEMGQYQLFS